jgi:Cell Wall Hydrolase.
MNQQRAPRLCTLPVEPQQTAFERDPTGKATGLAQSGQVIDVVPHGLSDGGTAAALCTDQSGARHFVLTCGHVFLGVKAPQLQHIDLLDGGQPMVTNGIVKECRPEQDGQFTAIDAALVEVSAQTARTLAMAYPHLRPLTTGSAGIEHAARLSIRASRGPIAALLVEPLSNYPVSTGSGRGYTLSSVAIYRMNEATQPGDSGAAVWDAEERLVGIHCGVCGDNPRHGFFCEIDKIAYAFGIRVLTREGKSEAPEAAAPISVAQPTAAETAARELDIVTRTIWGEGDELGEEAMRAVAKVILNRRTFGKWWGKSATEVCLRPYQFRCWDPSSRAIHRMRDLALDDPALLKARKLAETALSTGFPRDPTFRATHYHPNWVIPAPPWARDKKPCAAIAGLLFYDDID